ncbi:MAG: sensor histidine kinase [Clostridia bacterium]|nr:MAG: sensor histidine kinase [Clostridia bacterium]
MQDVLQSGFFALYFVSGLSFFTMGLAIAVQYRSFSTFRLAASLNLLAAFGILYGFSEWGNVFVPLQVPDIGVAAQWKLVALQRLLQALAYFFLFLFGVKLFRDTREGPPWLIWLPMVPFVLWLASFLRFAGYLDNQVALVGWLQGHEGMARLLLALPGSVASAWALWKQRLDLRVLQNAAVNHNLYVTVTALGLMAVSTGLLIEPSSFSPFPGLLSRFWSDHGLLPVQIFRTFVGFILAISMTRILAVFDLESQRRMDESRRQQAILLERDRFSRDLHDGVLQAIYGVGLTLQMCTHLLNKNPEAATGHIEYCMTKLNEVVGNIRDYISDLQPPQFQVGLKELIMELVEEFRLAYKIEVSLVYEEDRRLDVAEDRLPHLYYLIREAMSNAARHGQAGAISLHLRVDESNLRVTIEDDGKGFVYNPNVRDHFGLRFMEERAKLLGGQFHLASSPGQGTRVEVAVPVTALVRSETGIRVAGTNA